MKRHHFPLGLLRRNDGERQLPIGYPVGPVLVALTIAMIGLFLTGCAEKTLLPPANFTVTKVDPNILEIANPVTANSTEPVTLPPCSVSIRSENGVPARLISFSVAYQTRLGDPLPALEIPPTPYDLDLPPNSEAVISFNPFSIQTVELFIGTLSDIGPIRAGISMTIKDVNGNTTIRTAHCLLKKPIIKY